MRFLTKFSGGVLALGLVLALALLTTAPAPADDDGSPVIPPTSATAYRVYQELSAVWWNWAFAQPMATNPVVDSTGKFCHVGQKGPVWFLAGTFGGSATRHCTVPKGKALFFPVINSVWAATSPDETEEEMRAGANADIDQVTIAECRINGQPVKKLLQRHRVESQAFTLHLPKGAILDELYGLSGDLYPAVTDGYWVLVRPLKEGKHVIHFRGVAGDPRNPLFETEVTYHLRVVEDDDD